MSQNISESFIDERKKYSFDGITRMHIIAYGIGHFINDLCSTCWFTYLLFFLEVVVKTPAASAAILSGQITDAIATPLVGYGSDHTSTRFGQRKPWYVFGFILVIIAFLPTFHNINYNH